MFCRNCGAQISDDSKFCEKCGTAVIKRTAGISRTNLTDNGDIEQKNVSFHTKANTGIQTKKLVIVMIAAVFVIAAAAVCFTIYTGGNGGDSAKFYQELNFNSGAFFAYDDERLYFISARDGDDERSLFSTDHNGNNRTKISRDKDIIRIRVINGKIYYQKSTDDGYSIGVMNTDGSEDKTIVELEEIAGKYDFVNDQLYYLTGSDIHVCTISGEDDQILIEDASTFAIQGNRLIYSANSEIYSFNLKSKEQILLCKAPKASDLACDGKQLYFSGDDGLYCVPLKEDSAATQIIYDSDFGRYTFLGNDVYYVSKMSDSERERLAERMADSESDAFIYGLTMIGCGPIYKMNISDGRKVETDSDQLFAYTLYTYPNGLYCKVSAFSNTIEEVKFD